MRADSFALKGHLAAPGDSFGSDTAGRGGGRKGGSCLWFAKAGGAAKPPTMRGTASYPARMAIRPRLRNWAEPFISLLNRLEEVK